MSPNPEGRGIHNKVETFRLNNFINVPVMEESIIVDFNSALIPNCFRFVSFGFGFC